MKKIIFAFLLLFGVGSLWGAGPRPMLIADYNRDGQIDYFDRERAEKGEAFTIWLNDDDDAEGSDDGANAGDVNSDLHDVPGEDGNDRDCDDTEVNGRCDLLDFFPVLIDLNGVDRADDYIWKLNSKSVNVVFTQLKADKSGDFHTKEVKALDDETPLYKAEVKRLAGDEGDEEVVLPDGFIDHGRGVILIEGAALGDEGLTLRGEKAGCDPVEETLDLRVKNVEEMYGWIDLRPEEKGAERNGSGEQLTDNRHFVFVHGYNTNHEEARGSAAEFYKKLRQSGSDARFTAVEWRGDQSRIEFLGVKRTLNYFANVANAFKAAKALKETCNKLDGNLVLVGQGLGNVVIASAIKDYGLDYLKFVMIDAEIAGKEFETNGRFANLPRTINYYSPSDSFFKESEIDIEQCDERDMGKVLFQGAGFWSLNAKIKTSDSAVGIVNGIMTDVFDVAEEDVITEEQLAYSDIIELPAAGARAVSTLENINLETFIGENYEWPVVEKIENDWMEEDVKVWGHSTFGEVAYYHTSALYRSLAAIEPQRIIIDTDLGSSMDDLFVLDLAARMHNAGKIELKAVMMNRPDGSNAVDDPHGTGEFLKFADRYLASLGLGDLPLGKSIPLEEDRLPQWVFNPYWTLIYSNNVTGVGLLMPTNRTDAQIASLENAVALYRRILEDAPDKSVVICSVGFFNNLKALMESEVNYEGDNVFSTGRELVAAKVKELRIMGGCFDPSTAPDETNGAEYNAAGDPGAAKMVFEEWPTPVVVSPWEVGLKLEYKPNHVLADFSVSRSDPVLHAAYTYWPEPQREGDMNRLWDVMTMLPLTEGEAFAPLSESGRIEVDKIGKTTFVADSTGNRYYQLASRMDVSEVMARLRKIFRTSRRKIFTDDSIGVCSWSWHEPMTNIIRRMEANGFKGIQLALSPWVWEGEGSAAQKETFGDQEGEEVFNLISNKFACGELDIHATMICFSNEDYTTEHTISNTCGFYYGLAPSCTDEQKELAALTWTIRSNQFAKAVERTRMLGVKNITAHIGLSQYDDEKMSRLYWACKTCNENGCKLLVETGMYSAEETVDALKQFTKLHPDVTIGLNFDTANQILYGADTPRNAYEIMKEWIGQVHIKDCIEKYEMRGSWATDVEWGRGDVSRGYDMITFLKEVGFTGPMLVEHESGSPNPDVREREILTAIHALRGEETPVVAPGETVGPFADLADAEEALECGIFDFEPTDEVQMILEDSSIFSVADYKSMFKPIFKDSGAGVMVTFGLTEGGVNALVKSANDMTSGIDLAAIAELPMGESMNFALTGGIPGFYYTLYAGAEAMELKADARSENWKILCGAEGAVEFKSVKKPSEKAGFFAIGAGE